MPRSYRHIKEYEKEILELKAQKLTKREIGEKLGSLTSKYTILSADITKINENFPRVSL